MSGRTLLFIVYFLSTAEEVDAPPVAEATKPKKRLVLAGAVKKKKSQSKAPIDDGQPWYKTPQEAMAAAIAANPGTFNDPEKAMKTWTGSESKPSEPHSQKNIKQTQVSGFCGPLTLTLARPIFLQIAGAQN